MRTFPTSAHPAAPAASRLLLPTRALCALSPPCAPRADGAARTTSTRAPSVIRTLNSLASLTPFLSVHHAGGSACPVLRPTARAASHTRRAASQRSSRLQRCTYCMRVETAGGVPGAPLRAYDFGAHTLFAQAPSPPPRTCALSAGFS
ncbi:hypothetical protein DFH09DRAFT_1336719 [Mycena vulgaris]|nr:hypothetical protein DFH09DRAFT_1336719 [Mycena vulgaris]